MDIDGESLLANLALARVQFFGDGLFERSAELSSLFERYRLTPELRDELLRGLRAAGLRLA